MRFVLLMIATVMAAPAMAQTAFPCDWHRDLIEDFAAAIRDQRAPAITGREALRVHALIDAMVASSKTGRISDVSQEG